MPKYVKDNDGWIHLLRHTGQNSYGTSQLPTQAAQPSLLTNVGPAYINRTVDELKKDYLHHARKFEMTEMNKSLMAILWTGDGKAVIKDMVCLGLGSLLSANHTQRRTSLIQLAALRAMMRELGVKKAILQDPAFTAIDKEFLGTLDLTVVESPEALNLVSESTMLYSVHCYEKLYMAVARQGLQPALTIMNDLEVYARGGREIPESLKAMVDGCEEVQWPKDDSMGTEFAFTKIYWRRRQ